MRVRPAAVAGMFYPDRAEELRGFIEDALSRAEGVEAGARAVIAPHAGYVYSGWTAAFAYKALYEDARRFIIVGPAHRVPTQGLAVPTSEVFDTPLGAVPVDDALRKLALSLPEVYSFDATHAWEHSVEVHLPFLQVLHPEARILPLVAGLIDTEDCARVLDRCLDLEDTALIVSSDLSHYHPYENASAIDRQTIERILSLDDEIRGEQACGCAGVNALARVASRRGWKPRLLDYRNSGDTAGDRDAVVGYAAIGFYPE